MIRKLFAAVVLLFSTHVLFAQELDSLLNLNAFTEESALQKQLNKNVSVSAQKLSTRETPGILSVITSEEIQNSGARDLTDVLRLVPGFEVMQDLQFVMGLGLRGSWANEGKVLVMVDGQAFNELLYQSVAVGNRFFVDAIERIEIIRGPGSAIYGGSAEYGVINIVSKAASTQSGLAVYGSAGLHTEAVGRASVGITVASNDEPLAWDFSVFKGRGIVSDRQYQDIYLSDPVNLSKRTDADPFNMSMGLRFKGLSVRTMFDRFETSDPDYRIHNDLFFIDANYKINISEKFSLTPKLQYMNQVPWSYGDYSETILKIKATRILNQWDGNLSVSRKTNINFGMMYFRDQSSDELENTSILTLNNFALYAQGLFKHRLANATVGLRFEKNNRYDGALVPRIALTKKIENLHFKALVSKSFRSPGLRNVELDSTGSRPEKSNVYEFEIGYQFTPEMLLVVNAFHITTKNIIVYGYRSSDDKEWYENAEKSGSKGVEVVYSIRKKNWYANITYSFSQPIDDNTVDVYVVPQTEKQYVGFSAHKFTLNTCFALTSKISFNPSFIGAGKRYAFTAIDEEENPVATTLPAYYLINSYFNFRDIVPGLTAGVGVYDLLNQKPSIPQAYNGKDGIYAPIPGRSREYVVKLSYQLNFKK